MKRIIFFVILTFIITSVYTQNTSKLSLSGEFKTLGEFRQGYKTLLPQSADAAFVISQRSRLILDYKSDKFDLRFSAQDARAWGETFIINSTKPILLYEAWVKYKFNPYFNLTIGRQSLKYGDKRIITDRNWCMEGAAYDAALLHFKKKDLWVDFGLALNNNSTKLLRETPYTIPNFKTASWLWISKSFSPQFTLNLIDVFAGYQKENTITTYGLNTFGLNPVFKSSGFDFNSAAYFQFGKNDEGNKHLAHIYTLNLSYTYQVFGGKVGYDHYSGKSYDDTSSTDQHFIQLMETNPHVYLGFMDFTKGNQFQYQSGISDFNFYLKYGKSTSFTAYFHSLAYAEQPEADLSKNIGKEVDLLFSHKFDKQLSITLGYSFMLPHDDFIKSALGTNKAKFAQWGWAMLVFTPKLL